MKVLGALKLPSPSLDGSIQKYIGSNFFGIFSKKITCLEYDKGGHAYGYEHVGSVGNFLLFESTFLTQNKQLSSQQLFGGVRHRTSRVANIS